MGPLDPPLPLCTSFPQVNRGPSPPLRVHSTPTVKEKSVPGGQNGQKWGSLSMAKLACFRVVGIWVQDGPLWLAAVAHFPEIGNHSLIDPPAKNCSFFETESAHKAIFFSARKMVWPQPQSHGECLRLPQRAREPHNSPCRCPSAWVGSRQSGVFQSNISLCQWYHSGDGLVNGCGFGSAGCAAAVIGSANGCVLPNCRWLFWCCHLLPCTPVQFAR